MRGTKPRSPSDRGWSAAVSRCPARGVDRPVEALAAEAARPSGDRGAASGHLRRPRLRRGLGAGKVQQAVNALGELGHAIRLEQDLEWSDVVIRVDVAGG